MSDERVTRHLRVTGRVQGVGFRWFVMDRAQEAGVCGWVRNERDGSVEAVVQGPPPVVETVIEAVRRGPMGARVDAVVVSTPESPVVYDGFDIRP